MCLYDCAYVFVESMSLCMSMSVCACDSMTVCMYLLSLSLCMYIHK